ncbi:hypothetical protein SAMD00019534_113650 [Acytostelium subglobosum LB1]|uniref:hypothetical protein n=1 Tax=Acytostelium subglobosum LB1 TaxID=1410327 RepID=UPI0006449CBF|nr:hypothetical protein SAMD00019534_113650 [Acytostelium subglobosum LB1]GAM28189.1 hypothetical protein SAMD00019534_113650 [Acytostelium subglobosum LB1]|eukprot:XP_012748823.1 hypothetical protein SAMD00019534_113650 [Acytostelium subglobosum LB1]
MIQYNATQYFITEYDRVASTYPPNNTLLTHSIEYNNQRVFDHLLQNTNMSIPMKYGEKDIYTDVITAVVTSGNVYMLQTFFDMTGHGFIKGLKGRHLGIALSHNNEHFARLLLQHLIVPFGSLKCDMTGPGIKVNMLRLLNEEFAIHRMLNNSESWLSIVEKTISCDMAESVEYLLNHMPSDITTSNRWSRFIRKCCSNGYIDTLKVIIQHPNVTGEYKVINKRCLGDAIDSGQVHIVKYLIDEHLDLISDAIASSKKMVESAMDLGHLGMIDMLLDEMTNNTNVKFAMQTVDHKDLSKVPLLLEAVKCDNISVAQLILKECDPLAQGEWTDEVESILLNTMTHEMGMLIASQKHRPLPLTDRTLKKMMNKLNDREGKVTVELVKTLISNNHFGHDLEKYSKLAGHSLELMQLVTREGNYTFDYLEDAIKKGNVECIIYLSTHVQPSDNDFDNDYQQYIMDEAIKSCTLDTVRAIFDHLAERPTKIPLLSFNSLECAINNTTEVFEFVLNRLMDRKVCDPGMMDKALWIACKENNLFVLKILVDPKIGGVVSLEHYDIAATSNSYQVIEYLLKTWPSSPFIINMTNERRLRTINTVLNIAYGHGFIRIINLCHSIFKDIRSIKNRCLDVRGEIDDDHLTLDKMDLIIPTSTSSSRMSTAFHMVFRDKRLGMIIMRMIGDLYRTSFGIKDCQLIKGKQLVDSDILVDFIKYGANEWFIKSFNSVSNIYPFNSQMISYAIIYANAPILDILLTNTNMTFAIDSSLPDMLLTYLKQNGPYYKNAGWDSIISVVKSSIGRSTLAVNNQTFAQTEDGSRIIKILTGSENIEHWLALDHDILREAFSLITDEMERFIAELSKDDVLTKEDFDMIEVFSASIYSNPIVAGCMLLSCADHGLQEDLDHILRYIPASQLPPNRVMNSFSEAVRYGHFEFAKRLFTIITNDLPTDEMEIIDPLFLLNDKLKQGLLDQAMFLCDLPNNNNPNNGRNTSVVDIHPRILSIGLLRRLMAHPNIRCTFQSVMARAILNGDKDCIDLLELNQDLVFETDYRQALWAAARIGDVALVDMIMTRHPRGCMPLQDVEEYGNEFSPIKRARHRAALWACVEPAVGLVMARHIASGNINKFGIDTLSNIMESTCCPQTKMTYEVVQAFIKSWLETTNNDQDIIDILKNAASHSYSLIKLMHTIFIEANHRLLFTRAIPQCAQRGDTQTIKFILDVAQDATAATGNGPLNLNLNVLTDLKSIKISDVDVMTMLMDTGIIQNTQQYHPIIVGVLDHACSNGLVDMMTFIDQHQTDIRLVPSLQSIDKIVIHKVLIDTSLCQLIFKHVNIIHQKIIKSDRCGKDTSTTTTTTLIKSVIKGKQLLDRGDLKLMLRYNATQYFIEEYDRVASTYPPNDILLEKAITFNNVRVFDHLLRNTNMSLPTEHSDDKLYNSMITSLIRNGSVHMLQTYLDITAHCKLSPITHDHILMAINHNNEQFVQLLLQYAIIENDDDQDDDHDDKYLTLPGVNISMLHLLNNINNNILQQEYIWKEITLHSVRNNMLESVQYLLDHIPTILPMDEVIELVQDDYIEKCCNFGHFEILKVLVHYLEKAADDGHEAKVIINLGPAVTRGHANFIKSIYDQGYAGYISDQSTICMDALINGHVNVVELFLNDELVNLPMQSQSGET